jgi:hypothetical protein
MMKLGRRATVFAVALVGIGQVALAGPVPLDSEYSLEGAGATWDMEANYDYGKGSGGPCTSKDAGYTAREASYKGKGDAFDGGLYVKIGSTVFDDPDAIGRLNGQRMRVGPMDIGPLVVSRVDQALETSPTLRTLVRLVNTSKKPHTTSITWDSGMGADGSEATRGSSAAPAGAATAKDDWIVTSDDPGDVGDPAVTFAVYGPGDIRVRNRAVPFPPEGDDPPSGAGCVVFTFTVTVPADSTRFVLFFTEMSDSNEKALTKATRFGSVRMGWPLMDGISEKVAKRVLNWDLP